MLGFMTYYFPGNGPASWKQRLADPGKQWKVGKSARTLANCWEASDGFPPDVSAVLDASGYEQLSHLAFVAGFPEHKVKLPGGSRSLQTDVYVLGSNRYGLASIAVEGKVLEPFGDTVADWLGDAPSKGKQIRLRFLAENLSLPVGGVDRGPVGLLGLADFDHDPRPLGEDANQSVVDLVDPAAELSKTLLSVRILR